jgi:hypothetical protein
VPLAGYTTADVKREFLTAKSCSPNCTISCVHQISHIDHWRAPQTSKVCLCKGHKHKPGELVKIRDGELACSRWGSEAGVSRLDQ